MDPKTACSAMVASVLRPWLAERGAKRSGSGFRRVADLGDVELVELRRSTDARGSSG